jgi:hypothetical protein
LLTCRTSAFHCQNEALTHASYATGSANPRVLLSAGSGSLLESAALATKQKRVELMWAHILRWKEAGMRGAWRAPALQRLQVAAENVIPSRCALPARDWQLATARRNIPFGGRTCAPGLRGGAAESLSSVVVEAAAPLVMAAMMSVGLQRDHVTDGLIKSTINVDG